MTPPTIDTAAFDELKATAGTDFVRELVDTFLTEAPSMLAELRESFANGDPERFRRAAHSLKSNGNTFGALTLGTLARDLELAGVVHVRNRGPSALADIEAEYMRVAAALASLRDE